MSRLASPASQIRAKYEVVVVGSGYGGGIAASRLARAGRSVCVIERGREYLPGEFPNTAAEAAEETQLSVAPREDGRPRLFDFHIGADINVLRGCGLGGTSLINANVSIQPSPAVFDDPCWPSALQADVTTRLADGYARAREMLRPVGYPTSRPPLAKMATLERSAITLQRKYRALEVNVTFEDLSAGNPVGVSQPACNDCGDCVSGCNVGAKNTTAMTYLPDAKNHGAEIFCELIVRRVEKAKRGYRVYYSPMNDGRKRYGAPELFVLADVVVLAAGSLGSTEILLRSKAAGLPVSDAVGTRFSGNGDVLGFSYENESPVNAVGYGAADPKGRAPVGPCITAAIDVRDDGVPLGDAMIVEEGTMPGALAPIMASAFATAAATIGEPPSSSLLGTIRRGVQTIESLFEDPHRGAVDATQTYLVMAHDGSDGRMLLDADDKLAIDWPGVGDRPIFRSIENVLRGAARANHGTFIPNPIWTEAFQHSLVTVHPLGGCPMGEDATSAAVNHKGQVFSGKAGVAVHEGLYVADGAVVPRSLGVNPLFTISALAERTCRLLAEDRGWSFDYTLPSRPKQLVPAPPAGLEFSETMHGFFSTTEKGSFEAAYEDGKAKDSAFRFVLTITAEDAAAFLEQRNHPATLFGTVEAKALSAKPLTATEGTFHLFVDDPDAVDTRNMTYRMILTDEDGKEYAFRGYKVIHDDPGIDFWSDTTTLYFDVFEGRDGKGPPVGKGILNLGPEDVAKLLGSLRALRASNPVESVTLLTRFGKVFVHGLRETYGKAIAPNRVLEPPPPPRSHRALRAPEAEIHPFVTADGVQLRLTRYRGGSKGPVVLAAGFGNTAAVYTLDTVDTTFVEALVERQYDVWLLDRRSSPAMPAAVQPFTEDDEALYDWPAAIETVRGITGAPDVQVVAHCMGCMTLLMATALGLEGVRNAVLSQVTIYFHTDFMNKLKARLKIASALAFLGVDTVTPTLGHQHWDAALEEILRLYPIPEGEDCGDPVCHRIHGIFGPVYAHAQLNAATHAAMGEIFGVANTRVLSHLLLILGKGHAVDHEGRDVYRSKLLERLDYPIHFIAGGKNHICRPSASADLLEELMARPRAGRYTRTEYPEYAHLDCFVGKDAARDVFPDVLDELDRYNRATR